MRMGWHVFGIIIGIIIYSIYRYSHEDCDDDANEGENNILDDETKNSQNQKGQNMMEEMPRTNELARNLLAKLGTEPKETEEGRIQFEYQGVLFLMETVDECLFVNLIWPWCHSFSKYDIDEFARARQVVNEINMRDTVSVFYTVTDSDEVAVHIKKHFLLTPQIVNAEEYLRTIIYSFFRTARNLDLQMEKKRLHECKQ